MSSCIREVKPKQIKYAGLANVEWQRVTRSSNVSKTSLECGRPLALPFPPTVYACISLRIECKTRPH